MENTPPPPLHGSDPLAARLRYLRRRRSPQFGDRADAALWVALATVVAWLFIAGVTGLTGS